MSHPEQAVLSCPSCAQKLRVPSNLGTLTVTCPVCRHRWDWEGAVASGRCSSCSGRGVTILGPDVTDGPGGRSLEGWVYRCDSCQGSGRCKSCWGTGKRRDSKLVGGFSVIYVKVEGKDACEQCDRKQIPAIKGQREVVFQGFFDGKEIGDNDRFSVTRFRDGVRFGLAIDSSYNARGTERVLLPLLYRTLNVRERGEDAFEVETDHQIIFVRHIHVKEVTRK